MITGPGDWRRAAEATTPCPGCLSEGCPTPLKEGLVPAERCKGTGKVALLPELRKVCHSCNKGGILWQSKHSTVKGKTLQVCETCEGTGWVLDPAKCHTGTLINGMRRDYRIDINCDSFGVTTEIFQGASDEPVSDAAGEDFDTTVLEAAVKALEKKA